jgi:hypothetical protein
LTDNVNVMAANVRAGLYRGEKMID